MPYNITAIPPPEDITGQASLPLARVKRILHLDEDINNCSNNAAFVITVATEMFIQYLAEQGHNVVKSERKPRRNIQYKDLANAVARIDNLEFLSDVIPRTIPYKQYREKKSREAANDAAVEAGQTTLDARRAKDEAINGSSRSDHEEGDSEEDMMNELPKAQEMEIGIRGSRTNGHPEHVEHASNRTDRSDDRTEAGFE
ncbi:MAG: hypothetical protein M1827_002452 [Pycnora praestabilis]|nr:MAG: hypothetical protein M1827_002452 [Pycnora praestabilis]